MFYKLYGNEDFPFILSKPPLEYLEDISPCAVACHLGLGAYPHLATMSYQAAVGNNKVTPEAPFLQTEKPHLPQLLLI